MPQGIPQGLLFAIAENPAAAETFRAMDGSERQTFLRRAQSAAGKQELRRMADALAARVEERPPAF